MSDTYTQPHLGQVFFRHPNQDRTQRDYAMCVSLIERGVVRGVMQWSAIIQDGRGGTEQITERSVFGSGSWRPLPQEELETQYGPGYRELKALTEQSFAAVERDVLVLRDAVTILGERLAALEKAEARRVESMNAMLEAAPPPSVQKTPPSPTKPLRTVDAGAAAPR